MSFCIYICDINLLLRKMNITTASEQISRIQIVISIYGYYSLLWYHRLHQDLMHLFIWHMVVNQYIERVVQNHYLYHSQCSYIVFSLEKQKCYCSICSISWVLLGHRWKISFVSQRMFGYILAISICGWFLFYFSMREPLDF